MEGQSSDLGEVILHVEGLKTYFYSRRGVAKAVDGVDLEVRKGETIGIVGESGSGKSMTALSIMRLVPAAGRIVDGHIWFEGEDLVQKSQHDMERIRGRRIAIIPQDPMTSLNPVLTVREQLTESIRLTLPLSNDRPQDRALELLRMVSIADPKLRMSNYPHQMSGGMRQRVVGAIGIASSPQVLIADEPTTSLDATVQLQYLRLLKQIQDETGVAIIFITHDFGIVAEICDRVAVMYAGKVVEVATVRDAFDRPAHPYTRALIESVPTVDKDVDVLPTIPGSPPTLDDLPVGCAFAPRCRYAFARCSSDPPDFLVGTQHRARCWLLDRGQRDDN